MLDHHLVKNAARDERYQARIVAVLRVLKTGANGLGKFLRGDIVPTHRGQHVHLGAALVPRRDGRQRDHHADGYNAEEKNQQILLHCLAVLTEESKHDGSCELAKTFLL